MNVRFGACLDPMSTTTTPTAGISGWRRTLLKNGLSKREEMGRSSRFLVSVGCTLAIRDIRESYAQLREPHPGY